MSTDVRGSLWAVFEPPGPSSCAAAAPFVRMAGVNLSAPLACRISLAAKRGRLEARVGDPGPRCVGHPHSPFLEYSDVIA